MYEQFPIIRSGTTFITDFVNKLQNILYHIHPMCCHILTYHFYTPFPLPLQPLLLYTNIQESLVELTAAYFTYTYRLTWQFA